MASRARQHTLDLGRQFAIRREHGGDLARGKRKIHRPLDPRLHQHIVLRSGKARGAWSLLHRRNRSRIDRIVYAQAARHGIHIDRFANVGNHLHILLKAPSKQAFQAFLRCVPGLVVRHVTGAQKGRALKLNRQAESSPSQRRFWDGLAYSRAVTWGRELEMVRHYLSKNQIEAIGFAGARLRYKDNGEPIAVIGSIDDPAKLAMLDPPTRRLFAKR